MQRFKKYQSEHKHRRAARHTASGCGLVDGRTREKQKALMFLPPVAPFLFSNT